MKFLKTIRAWWRGLFRKRRFNMLNATDNTEEWHMHLSPASILAGLVAFMLMLFILTLSLVAYSPILEFLPGYRTEADRSRESLVHLQHYLMRAKSWKKRQLWMVQTFCSRSGTWSFRRLRTLL